MAMFGPGGTVVELEAVKVNKTVLLKNNEKTSVLTEPLSLCDAAKKEHNN